MRHPNSPETCLTYTPVLSLTLSLLFLGSVAFAEDQGKPAPKGFSPKVSSPKVSSPKPVVTAKPAPKSTGRYGLTPPPLTFQPPTIEIPEAVYDWGAVLQGEVVTHPFRIKNTGGSVLRVEKVKPACGCTTVDYDKEIPPGGSGTITLKVETQKFAGSVKKTAEVSTNAGRSSQRLTIQGKIDLAVEVIPKLPRINVVRGVDAEPLTIKLKRAAAHKITVKSVTTKSTVVKTELKAVEPGELYQVEVTPQLPDDKKKYHYAQLDVAVEVNGRAFDIPVRVSMTVKDRITASPPSVYFSRRDTDTLKTPGAEPVSKVVKIESLHPDHDFKIVDVQILGEHFEHKLETVTEGKLYNVTVTLPQIPSETLKRRIVEKLVVRTDDPQLEKISLNITASIGRPRTPAAASQSRSVPAGTSVQKIGPKEIGPRTNPAKVQATPAKVQATPVEARATPAAARARLQQRLRDRELRNKRKATQRGS